MTAHPTAAEKLLAMLDDGQAVEALGADEVREDLALLGIDPAPSIAFAKALAAGHGTPGGRLLGGIGAAEDAEDEIARIESADIDEVRAQIPGGTAAAIAAEARRKADDGSNVVGMARRRRSRLLVWGAPITGIAASLLVVVVGYEVLTARLLETPLQSVQSAAPSMAESETPPPAGLSELQESRTRPPSRQDRASEAGESGDVAMAKRTRRDTDAPPAAVTLGNDAREALADDMASSAVEDADKGYFRFEPGSTPDSAERKREQKPSERLIAGADPNMTDSAGSAIGLLAEPAPPALERDVDTFAAESPAGEPDALARIVAVLVVDEGRAPESITSRRFDAGRLADRLEEARRVAAGRDVIALITLETLAGQADFAQVPLSPGMTQQLPPPAAVAGLLGADAMAYDFIALPPP